MSLGLERSEDHCVVRLGESLTMGSIAELHQVLVEALGSNRSVAIDLERLTELDFSGLQLLYAAARSGISLGVEGKVPKLVKEVFLEAGLPGLELWPD
jgi:anti-anti-sigma regulatory factor